jgi:anti-anti-sigma regulatory factor
VLRITTIAEPNGKLLLKLEGKLLEPWLGELTSACSPAPGRFAVRLDLSRLTYVDSAGVQTLKDLLQRGVTVVETLPFVAALLGLEDR